MLLNINEDAAPGYEIPAPFAGLSGQDVKVAQQTVLAWIADTEAPGSAGDLAELQAVCSNVLQLGDGSADAIRNWAMCLTQNRLIPGTDCSPDVQLEGGGCFVCMCEAVLEKVILQMLIDFGGRFGTPPSTPADLVTTSIWTWPANFIGAVQVQALAGSALADALPPDSGDNLVTPGGDNLTTPGGDNLVLP